MRQVLYALIFTLPLTSACAAEAPELATDKQKYSYAVGFQIGRSLANNQKFDVEASAFVQAIADVLEGREPQLSMEEMQQAMQRVQQQKAEEHRKVAEKNLETSQSFLAENKQKDGVKELDSGLQYMIVEEGSGDKPSPKDTVTVHYKGTLIDGTQFDSSYERGKPTTFPVNGVIKGWQEALPLMREGAKWKLFIPPKLAYGERGMGDAIGPNQALIFDVELLSIKSKQKDDGKG